MSAAAPPPVLRNFEAPFIHAPERARTMFLVTMAAACAPAAAGAVVFGWRAVGVIALSVLSCAAIERLYFRVTRLPALLGRSHAYLTGLLLGLTLPPFVPWYVPVIAAAFAIIVGKTIFGGVGHFLWQPALVGRVAVLVLLPGTLTICSDANPGRWPVLTQDKSVVGDVTAARRSDDYRDWRSAKAPEGADAVLLTPPSQMLASLGGMTDPPWLLENFIRTPQLQFSALAYVPDLPQARPSLIQKLPPLSDMLLGAQGGGVGETCGPVIIIAGLYLLYRNYVKWQLPVMFLLAAGAVAAVAPLTFAGAGGAPRTVWFPINSEGTDVGFVYISYHLFSGSMLLAAFFFATEMTSRPVTTGGQVIFGLGAGALAMLLRLYANLPASLPAYVAVLAMNTFTPLIDGLWHPRVFGRRRLAWVRRR